MKGWRRWLVATSAPQFLHLGNHPVQFLEHAAIHSVHIEFEDDAAKQKRETRI
jgi:hypothetical protein